jgi:cob(I)alamin adenosyltransferase
MKLYTRRGDGGRTSLFDGHDLPKDHDRIAAYGDVDELNAHVGLAAAMARDKPAVEIRESLHGRLQQVSGDLFCVGAELATRDPASRGDRIPSVGEADIKRLESWIDESCERAPALKTFVLPGGDALSAQLHVCRTVCRRAERQVVRLSSSESLRGEPLVYLNRLSDLFFAWAREVNAVTGRGDEPWINPKSRS